MVSEISLRWFFHRIVLKPIYATKFVGAVDAMMTSLLSFSSLLHFSHAMKESENVNCFDCMPTTISMRVSNLSSWNPAFCIVWCDLSQCIRKSTLNKNTSIHTHIHKSQSVWTCVVVYDTTYSMISTNLYDYMNKH